MQRNVKIYDEDDGGALVWAGPADAFEADNIDDGELCAAVRALEPGEAATFGGGAAPTFRVVVELVEPCQANVSGEPVDGAKRCGVEAFEVPWMFGGLVELKLCAEHAAELERAGRVAVGGAWALR